MGVRRRRLGAGATIAALLLAGTGCTNAMGDQGPTDSANALIAHADAAGSRCVIVLREGEVILATPGPAEPQRAWSITKSVTSLLMGIAAEEHEFSLDDTAATYIPEWRDTASASVTIRDLLSMVSGREWTRKLDYGELALRAADKTAFAVGLGQDSVPGTEWQYSNSAVQALEAVLRGATGLEVDQFARQRLFEPLGMTSSFIETDEAGHANLFAGMMTTCIDLAILGEAVRAGGKSDAGEQVIPSDYLQRALQPSTELNAAYGLLWWLNRPGNGFAADVATGGEAVPIEGPLVPEAGPDAVWALGFQQQILAIIPSLDAVAVRLGERPAEITEFDMRTFTLDVLDVIADDVPK